MRRRRPGFSRPSVGGYYRTCATRLGRRLFEITMPRGVLYYATRRIRLDKAKCRDAKMEKEHYMKVITYY